MYLVDGRTFGPDEPALTHALESAYDRHARPRCLCASAAAPVYIAKANEAMVLKRMPRTGHLHDPGCRHHEPSDAVSPFASNRPAIQEDPVTGSVSIRANFSLSSHRTTTPSLTLPQNRTRTDLPRLGLRELLLYLWRRAQLTVWRPAFAGKRSWAVVRHHLHDAASNVTVNGVPLADALFVPESFSADRADEIRARRLERFAIGFGDSPGRRMLLVGEVKDIVCTASRPHVVIRHLPDTLLFLGEVSPRCSDENLRRFSHPSIRLVMAATFSLPNATRPTIEDFCLVPMSAQWLPVDDVPLH